MIDGIDDDRPVYPIGVASELLGIHPRTIILYEKKGLLKLARRGRQRVLSNNDLKRIRCIRHLIHEKGLNLEGIVRLLALIPCWEIRGCTEEERANCNAAFDHTVPCWKMHARICQDTRDHCQSCEVYLRAKRREKVCKDVTDCESFD